YVAASNTSPAVNEGFFVDTTCFVENINETPRAAHGLHLDVCRSSDPAKDTLGAWLMLPAQRIARKRSPVFYSSAGPKNIRMATSNLGNTDFIDACGISRKLNWQDVTLSISVTN